MQRQARARALILAFEERWNDYADKDQADAVPHYGTYIPLGAVTATWLARLASVPWLTTREPGLQRACPRDLAVLTEARSIPRGKIGAATRESSKLKTHTGVRLGARHPGPTSSLVRRPQLEDLKDAEPHGSVEQRQADRCLQALANFVSGGRHESESDLSDRQIRSALTDPGRNGGLIRVSGEWLSPVEVSRGPPIHESLPCTNVAPGVFEAVGVPEPSAGECVQVCRRWPRTRRSIGSESFAPLNAC